MSWTRACLPRTRVAPVGRAERGAATGSGRGTISDLCSLHLSQPPHSVPRTNIWPKYDNSWPGAGSILIGQCLKTTKIPSMNCASKELAIQHKVVKISLIHFRFLRNNFRPNLVWLIIDYCWIFKNILLLKDLCPCS